MKKYRRRPVAPVTLCAVAAISSAAQAIASGGSVSWAVDSSGDWGNAANWTSVPSLPGPADDVTIDRGAFVPTVTLSSGVQSINSLLCNDPLVISGGTLNVATTAQLNSALIWTNGTIAGSVNGNGGIDLRGGTPFITNGSLTNAFGQSATMGSGGTAYLLMQSTATFTNNGTLTAADGTILPAGGTGTKTFNNAGTFNVDESVNEFDIGNGVSFNNTGIVNVRSGRLAIGGPDGGATSGTFNLSAGATLIFGGNTTLSPTSTVSGAGSVTFTSSALAVNLNGTFNIGGSANFGGGNININSPCTAGATVFAAGQVNVNTNFDINSSTVFSGANVVFTKAVTDSTQSAVSISAGSVSLGASTITLGALTLSSTGNIYSSGQITVGHLIINGFNGGNITAQALTVTHGMDFQGGGGLHGGTILTNPVGQVATFGSVGTPGFYLGDSATFVNAGLFLAFKGNIYNSGGSGPRVFNNIGTIDVNSPGMTFGGGTTFTNNGTVNVQSGGLTVGTTGSNGTLGTYNLAPGTSLNFATDSFSGQPGTVTLGPGIMIIGPSATLNFIPSAFSFTGTASVLTSLLSIGTINVKNFVSADVNETWAGNTSFNNATFFGAGTLTVTGTNDAWVNGSMTGTGMTLFASGSALTIGSNATSSAQTLARPIQIGGSATLIGGGTNGTAAINMSGGTFTILPGGSLTLSPGATTPTNFNNTSGTNLVSNAGTLTKTSANSATISVPFSNTGTVNVQQGSLSFAGTVSQMTGTTLTAGTWSVSNGAALVFPAGSSVVTNQGSVSLNGTGTFAAVTALANNQGSFNLGGGRSFSSAGGFSNSGSLSVGSGSTFISTGLLTLSGGSAGGAGSVVANVGAAVSGQVLLSGTGAMKVIGALTVNGGARLDVNAGGLIVEYPAASPIAAIRSQLISGFNAGNWNGNGIASLAAHNDPNFHTALGYSEASALALSTFDGLSVGSKDVVVKYTYYGDSNLDGKVTTSDFQRFLDGLATGGSTWIQGDYTYDGKVDLGNDFNVFLGGFLAQGGTLGDLSDAVMGASSISSVQRAALLSIVPEPGMMAIVFALPAFASRRRASRPGRRC